MRSSTSRRRDRGPDETDTRREAPRYSRGGPHTMYRFEVGRDLRGCDHHVGAMYAGVNSCVRASLFVDQTVRKNSLADLLTSPREEARVVQIGRIMMLRLWAITKEAAMAAIHA